MGMEAIVESDPLGIAPHHAPCALSAEPPAPLVQEDGLGVATPRPPPRGQSRPTARSEPIRHRRMRDATERQHPLLRSLAEHPDHRVAEVEIAQREAAQLADAHPRPIEQFEDGPVAVVGSGDTDGGGKKASDLLLAERFRKRVGCLRDGQVNRRVARRRSFVGQKSVQRAHRDGGPEHRSRCQ